MNQNKVTVEVKTYDEPAQPPIRVHSHSIFDDRIVLEHGNGKVTVIAQHLQDAIKAATIHENLFG